MRSGTSKTGPVEVHVDADPDLPDLGHNYLHCVRCLAEWTESFQGVCSPQQYARQQCSTTATGVIQVRCTRHGCNICTFTIERGKKGAKR